VATVECSGELHRIAWRRGKLVLEDHDLGAERTMLALGGEMPACLATVQLWRNLHTWAMASELFRQVQHRMGGEGIFGPGDLAGAHALGLALTWERAWRRGGYFTDHGRLLAEQLRAAALPELRDHLRFWMRQLGSRRLSSVQVEVGRGGAPATLAGEMDTVGVRATATLSARWLTGIWARGLTVVSGAFVVEVAPEPSEPGPLAVRAVRWESDGDKPGRFRPVEAPALVTGADGPAEDRHLTWAP
jgi:hypothetical protein